MVLPDAEELWLLSRSTGLALHLQRVDVCDGDDSRSYIPGQAHEGAYSHQYTHPEQVQVVATTFLQLLRWQEVRNHSSLRLTVGLNDLSSHTYTDQFSCDHISTFWQWNVYFFKWKVNRLLSTAAAQIILPYHLFSHNVNWEAWKGISHFFPDMGALTHFVC